MRVLLCSSIMTSTSFMVVCLPKAVLQAFDRFLCISVALLPTTSGAWLTNEFRWAAETGRNPCCLASRRMFLSSNSDLKSWENLTPLCWFNPCWAKFNWLADPWCMLDFDLLPKAVESSFLRFYDHLIPDVEA